MNQQIAENLEIVRNQIRKVATGVNRNPEDVLLLAVSKMHTIDKIRIAYAAGQVDFGENKVQELISKAQEFFEPRWHLIGHLQTNKVKQVLPYVYMIHSLDSVKLALEIQKHAENLGLTVRCLVQIHISGETTKTGLEPTEVHDFFRVISDLPNIQILGLMGMASMTENESLIRGQFNYLYQLKQELMIYTSPQIQMTHLSMGMSSDFSIAIEAGSTIVRIGSAIFGNR